MTWMCKLYMKQVKAGRHFLHEHPAHATSWNKRLILEMLQLKDVRRIEAHQCQLGREAANGEPIMKKTSFMSNCADILERPSPERSG